MLTVIKGIIKEKQKLIKVISTCLQREAILNITHPSIAGDALPEAGDGAVRGRRGGGGRGRGGRSAGRAALARAGAPPPRAAPARRTRGPRARARRRQ